MTAAPATDVAPPGSAAELAARHGLARSGARPGLAQYAGLLWQRRHFIVAYARARNTAQYSGSLLGSMWQLLTPLLNAAVYYLIFGLLLKSNRGIENFAAFLVAGVFVFTFTQRAVLAGGRAVSGNLGLIRALHFPRAALPLAATVMELQQVLISSAVLMVIVVLTGEPITLAWLLVVPALALQTVFNCGLALVFARLTSRVRDLEQLLPFALRTWQYASGVFFSIAVVARNAPGPVRGLLEANPAAVYIGLVRHALLGTQINAGHTWSLAVLWAVLVFAGGFVYFWKAEELYGRG